MRNKQVRKIQINIKGNKYELLYNNYEEEQEENPQNVSKQNSPNRNDQIDKLTHFNTVSVHSKVCNNAQNLITV